MKVVHTGLGPPGQTLPRRDLGQTMMESRRRGFGPPGQTRGFMQPYFTPSTNGFLQAQADLAAKVVAQLTNGDSRAIQGDVAGAVQAYQTGGNAGATSVGPEIDAAGAPNVTQPYTQMAYQSNGVLAAINPTSVQDPGPARALLASMIGQYQIAIAQGMAAQRIVPPPPIPPPPAPQPQPAPQPNPQPSTQQAAPTNYTPWIIGGAVVVGGGILAWALKGRRR